MSVSIHEKNVWYITVICTELILELLKGIDEILEYWILHQNVIVYVQSNNELYSLNIILHFPNALI